MADVLIVSGSANDLEKIKDCFVMLTDMGLTHEVHVASAHRTPAKVEQLSKDAKRTGVKVIIAVAGMSAALPGVMAAHSPLPVIGLPIEGKIMGGLDAILSMVQMPGGVPVGTVAIGSAGAKNAALLAARIIALQNKTVEERLESFIKKMNAA